MPVLQKENPKTTSFWQHITNQGAPRRLEHPGELLRAFTEYVQWCEANPLYEEVLNFYKGRTKKDVKAHPRPLTVMGFCQFSGIAVTRFYQFKDRGPDWADAIEMVENGIKQQKFEYAATGFYNANFIARDLKMSDRNEVSGPDGGPMTMEVIQQDATAFAKKMAAMASRQQPKDEAEEKVRNEDTPGA